jgi:hypothetical protein
MKEIYYKIVEVKNHRYRFLFHGVNKSKNIIIGKWYTATVKIVRDGSSYPYKSGFHFFNDYETAEKYLKKFKNQDNKMIAVVEIDVVSARPKGPRTEVWLTEKIKFI